MQRRSPILPLVFLVLTHVASAPPARAAWPSGGLGVCTASSQYPVVTPDGAGGAVLVWQDLRSGSGDIYAQRVNAYGVPQWTANGVAVCTVSGNQSAPQVIADGAGGFIIGWHDARALADIYVQRLNGSGVPQWTANGVGLTALLSNKTFTGLVTDGAGGAIAVWEDTRTGNSDVYARRVTAAGTPAWTANGTPVCAAADAQMLSVVAADGQGGAVIGWSDFRASFYADFYAQRINGSGATMWAANGIAVRSYSGKNAYYGAVASLGADGVIFAWSDDRNYSSSFDIYAQRVTLSGTPVWTSGGVAVAAGPNYQLYAQVTPDGSGGMIIGWVDAGSGPAHVYAQRLSVGGTELWTSGGRLVSSVSSVFNQIQMVADGTGGAIFTWDDSRGGTGAAVYAQRIDASGYTAWQSGDVLLGNNSTGFYPRIATDGAGGAVVGWQDSRAATSNIYAQRIERGGNWGFPCPTIAGVRDVPADQGGQVNLSWNASRLDPWPAQEVYQYSIWRAIKPTAANAAISSGATIVTGDLDPLSAGPDAIRVEQLGATTYYWKFVKTASAWGLNAYSEDVPTLFDWGAGPGEQTYFQVIAHAYSSFWASAPDSGYSVDNLAPAAPLSLTAMRSGNDVLLQWRKSRDADLRDYAVYRATASGVLPDPAFFLSNAMDTLLTDTSAPAGALYYVVTAVDVHENQSAPSNEATVTGGPTGITPRTPSISTLTVLPNAPNPFTGTTMFEIGLPVESQLDVEVYDVAGRRVRALSAGRKGAGWQRVAFDGRDDEGQPLASGVYFYRVRAGGTTVTSKMVIAR
jgi:hypothetical protein